MMEWLDTVRNREVVPNENYARELQELFTLGVMDLAPTPQPNYTQADIVQIARAFTGWRYDDAAASVPERLPARLHEDVRGRARAQGDLQDHRAGSAPPGGTSTDQGRRRPAGDRRASSTSSSSTRDSTGKNTVARRTAYRLCEYLAQPSPSITGFVDQVVDRLRLRHRAGTSRRWCAPSSATTTSISPRPPTIGATARSRSSGRSTTWSARSGCSSMKPEGKYYQILGGSYPHHARPPDRHGAGDRRSAQRLRLGLGGGVDEQRHAARALQLRPRPDVGARRRRAFKPEKLDGPRRSATPTTSSTRRPRCSACRIT